MLIGYSKLVEKKRQNEIVDAIAMLEPRLTSVQVIKGDSNASLYVDIGLPRMMPIGLLGEGIRRMLNISVAIAEVREGVLLIDEIENGIHYSVMPKVWTAIAAAARKMNVQVFATTHSHECIMAAHQAFSQSEPYDLSLFRLERRENDIAAVRFAKDDLNATLNYNLEVR